MYECHGAMTGLAAAGGSRALAAHGPLSGGGAGHAYIYVTMTYQKSLSAPESEKCIS